MWKIAEKAEEFITIPEDINKIAEMRMQAKIGKDWALADLLRDKIINAGYVIKDTKDGYIIEKAKQ